MAGLSFGLPFSHADLFASQQPPDSPAATPATQHKTPAPPPAAFHSLAEDDQFLNELEHANFLFFWEQANPETGLIKDRCNVTNQRYQPGGQHRLESASASPPFASA